MHSLKTYLLLTFSLVLFLLFLPHHIYAQDQRNPTTVLGSNQTINGDYFAANSNVDLEGTVDGDAFLAGGNVNVGGIINGDLLVAGGNVNIRGKVLGNVRSVGGQVTISGEVGKNVSVAGGNISLLNGAKVGGNLNVAGGVLSISSAVSGSANALVGQLYLSDGATISKDLTYWSSNPAQVSNEASVSGKITQNNPPHTQAIPSPFGFFRRAFILFILLSLISSLVIGVIIIRFLPIYTERVTKVIQDKPGTSFLVGLIAIIILPIILLALVITVIGIPLAVLVFATMVMFFFLARIFAAIFVGEQILKYSSKDASPYWSLVLGMLILGVITYIPIVGGLMIFILGLMGIGAVLIEEKDFYLNLRSKKLI